MKLSKKLGAASRAIRANYDKNYRSPLSIYYLITYDCPFKCRYCNIRGTGTDTDEMNTEQAKQIIREMAEAGTVKLQFTGGEPMMRKDIGELIELSRSLGIFTGISTSGWDIPARVDELKNTNIVFVSLDGEESVHDEIRGKGSHEVAMKAIDALKGADINLWLTTVINRYNINSIEYVTSLAEKMGIIVNFVMMHSRDESYSSPFIDIDEADRFMMNPDEYKSVLNKIIGLKKAGKPIGMSFSYLKHLLKWEDYKIGYKQGGDRCKCWGGRLYGFLEHDGMLYPCGTLHDKMKGADALNNGFQNAFNELEETYCDSCLSGCQMEQNMMFSLKGEAIYNWIRLL